jgi:hypothetical protein
VHVAEPADDSVGLDVHPVNPLNVSVPCGIPDPGAVATTVAVKVTGWPDTDGETDDVMMTRVAAAVGAATTTSVASVLPVKLPSPP